MTLVGIDVGGTFTDLFAIDDGGQLRITKVPSTPASPSKAVLDALAAAGIGLHSIEMLSHGTTIATNAFIQRRGARMGLITTRGFRDVLELGRRDRPQMYGMWGSFEPLVPRDRRWEIAERLDATGEVLIPLSESEVVAAGESLRDQEVEVVVVSLLHSYANPLHERRVRELLHEVNPEWDIVISSDVLREFYEFERASTACVQGYLTPLVRRYAATLTSELGERRYGGEVLIMQSNGGAIGVGGIHGRAAHLINSGPAAGVTGATYIGRAAGTPDLITADMGGTSFDVAVVQDYRCRISEETQLDFRIPLRIPNVDVTSIGAGGGSIAWVDGSGLVRVGPQSAGADPGPAAYGLGGKEPTVTDANLVLGRIDPDRPLGGIRRLDLEAAGEAIGRLGEKLHLDVTETAAGILDVVNNNMAGLIRMLTVERGLDPREFVYVPFGGAGPLHSSAIAKLLGIRRILIPRYPGVLSGLGAALAEVRHDTTMTLDVRLADDAILKLRSLVGEHDRWGRGRLDEEGVDFADRRLEHNLDMCYEGQLHTIQVPFGASDDVQALAARFEDLYNQEFGALLKRPIRVINLRSTVVGVRPIPEWNGNDSRNGDSAPRLAERRVFSGGRWSLFPVFERRELCEGSGVAGPCLIEQKDCSIVIEAGISGAVDAWGNLQLEVEERE